MPHTGAGWLLPEVNGWACLFSSLSLQPSKMPTSDKPVQRHDDAQQPATEQRPTQKRGSTRRTGNTERVFEARGQDTEHGPADNQS
jgi:hypothetical protein